MEAGHYEAHRDCRRSSARINDYFGRHSSNGARPRVCGPWCRCSAISRQIIFEQYPARHHAARATSTGYNDSTASGAGASRTRAHGVRGARYSTEAGSFAFSQTWGHFWDIGGHGVRAGISPDATEISTRALIVPAGASTVEGVWNDEAFRHLRAENSRSRDHQGRHPRGARPACQLGPRPARGWEAVRPLRRRDRAGAGAWGALRAAVPRRHPQGRSRPRIPDGTTERRRRGWTATA